MKQSFITTTKCSKTKALISVLTITIIFFTSCQKDVNNSAGIQSSSSSEEIRTLQKDDASVATDWYNLQLQMILQANPAISPLAANRLFGYTGISLYEAARFEISRSVSLTNQLYQMPVMPAPNENEKYSWIVSANEAMANITRDLFPALTTANHASIDSLKKVYNDKITAEKGAAVVARSQAFGDSVAVIIFRWAQTDLFNHANDPYTPPVGPGLWVPTPPLYLPAAAPYAGNCRPFLKIHSSGTTLPPPHKYSDEKGSDFYLMAKNLYKISQSITDEQKNIALYWNDVGAGIGYTPGGHNISIITQILKKSNANLATAEEVYVKAGIACWDATIVTWRSKYKYNQLRPVTYIRKNIDSTWLPLIGTPNHPEYPAAHAFITSAIMQTLSSIIGQHYSFTDHTYDFRGFTPRSYTSFEQASTECGESRVYGGIHYQPSVDVGHVYGESLGKDAAAVQLTK